MKDWALSVAAGEEGLTLMIVDVRSHDRLLRQVT